MTTEIKGCGTLLNPNGSSDRCGQADNGFGGKQLCVSCSKDLRIASLEATLSAPKAIVTELTTLDIQPGNVVVLRLEAQPSEDAITQLVRDVRQIIPETSTVAVLVGDADMSALTDESMRKNGWVRTALPEWNDLVALSDTQNVRECIENLIDSSSEDNAVCLIREILQTFFAGVSK